MTPPANQIRLPAIGLIATGAINLILSPLLLLGVIMSATGRSRRTFEFENDAERAGGAIASLGMGISSLLSAILAALIIYGAIQMIRGQKYSLARAAAILAMVPCTSCCFFVGAPFGIWALLVLSRPEVKTFFGVNDGLDSPPPPLQYH